MPFSEGPKGCSLRHKVVVHFRNPQKYCNIRLHTCPPHLQPPETTKAVVAEAGEDFMSWECSLNGGMKQRDTLAVSSENTYKSTCPQTGRSSSGLFFSQPLIWCPRRLFMSPVFLFLLLIFTLKILWILPPSQQPSALPRVNQLSRRVLTESMSHRIKLSLIVLTVNLTKPKITGLEGFSWGMPRSVLPLWESMRDHPVCCLS